METISINGLDKSVANRIKKGNGYYLLKKGKYSVARELETMSIVYVAKNHFDVEQAIDSEIGKCVELSEKTVSTKGAMIIEREMLDEIRVIIPKDTQMCEDSISDDEPKSERK
ncbi:TPA: hypothetical protein LY798_001772 [Enterococcus faecium]|nr:hypothetical protein [Enterococcus faecium]